MEGKRGILYHEHLKRLLPRKNLKKIAERRDESLKKSDQSYAVELIKTRLAAQSGLRKLVCVQGCYCKLYFYTRAAKEVQETIYCT